MQVHVLRLSRSGSSRNHHWSFALKSSAGNFGADRPVQAVSQRNYALLKQTLPSRDGSDLSFFHRRCKVRAKTSEEHNETFDEYSRAAASHQSCDNRPSVRQSRIYYDIDEVNDDYWMQQDESIDTGYSDASSVQDTLNRVAHSSQEDTGAQNVASTETEGGTSEDNISATGFVV